MRERQEAGMRDGQGGRDMGMRGREEEGGDRDVGQEEVTEMRGRRERPGCGAGWEKQREGGRSRGKIEEVAERRWKRQSGDRRRSNEAEHRQ
jgi:hypothetical protein